MSDADSPLDLIPSLHDLIATEGLDSSRLSVAIEASDDRRIRVRDRHSIPVTDKKKLAFWPVAALRELFRGNATPPADIAHYPPEYCGHFFFIESHVLSVCDVIGDRTDQEMEEIYRALRRRPEGRSLGPMHDFVWQVAALALGTRAWSSAEFEAVIGTLERSARTLALRPVSRNYLGYLRSNFNRIGAGE